MSFADIFNAEDYEDNSEDNIDNQIFNNLSDEVVEEIAESERFQDGGCLGLRESDKENCEMTLKPSELDQDQFVVEVLPTTDDLVEKLEKLATSEVGFNRQLAVCSVLETLRVVQGNEEAVGRVINILCSLSEDYGPTIRMEVMVKLPSIVQFCKEAGLSSTLEQYLLPVTTILNYLGEVNSLVRKTTHSSLISLIEQNLIDTGTVQEKICPLIVNLTDCSQPEDIRTESILLMSKIAVCLGRKVVEELFLDLFSDFCVDICNNIRKASASCFGDICSTVGRDITEKFLLPKFYNLCKDNAWCVRKACAENFMPVSCVVSREMRVRELAPLYKKLLEDQSRWVRLTAYQALGPFISTFAEPEKTGLYYSEDGVFTVVDTPPSPLVNSSNCETEQCPDSTEACSNTCDKTVPLNNCKSVADPIVSPAARCKSIPAEDRNACAEPLVNGICENGPSACCAEKDDTSTINASMCQSDQSKDEAISVWGTRMRASSEILGDVKSVDPPASLHNGHIVEKSEDVNICLLSPTLEDMDSASGESAFNHFQYWRDPLPELEKDEYYSVLYPIKSSKKPFRTSSNWDFRRQNKQYEMYLCINEQSEEKSHGFTKVPISEYLSSITPVEEQDIVPVDLLTSYLNMTDNAWAADGEIPRHCAYSLPAVAFTLGRKYWHCLRNTFNELSSDIQDFCQGFIMMWKVRRTVASSMHILAVILGPEITSRDLLPVFIRFISDLDEVRIGILQHLAEFLKVLQLKERKQLLPCLPEFLVSNNDLEISDRNWRFRLMLAEQLALVADLYTSTDVKDHLVPLSFTLIQDKICEVRLAAVKVMAAVVKKLSQHTTPKLTGDLMGELNDKFVRAKKWLHRQLFVYICQQIIEEWSLPADQFAEHALPHLLYLCWDPVPNVRIAAARCLAVIIWPLETFSGPGSPHRELILETIHTLQSDTEEDVRYYANKVSAHDCSCLQPSDNNIYLESRSVAKVLPASLKIAEGCAPKPSVT